MFLSRCGGKLGVEARDSELLWSFGGNSGFILCCSVGPRITLELWWGMQCASPVVVELSLELSSGQLVSSRDVQDGSCLAAMCGWLLTSSGMDFFSSCGRGQLCICGGFDFL